MKTSVASVTFRSHTVEQIVSLALQAGLDAIEWGGDVHVQPGDLPAAQRAFSCCSNAGIEISAYGSYYRAESSFFPVLETAVQLKTRIIRVWAGKVGSRQCSPEQRSATEEALRQAVLLADDAGCTVATEYHANTLTDTLESTMELLNAVPGLRTFWQPPVGLPFEKNIQALHSLQGRIENLHVYHRTGEGACRPLKEGAGNWISYLKTVQLDGAPHYATL